MIERSKIQDVASTYDKEKISIGIFGSHSALPTGYAAKKAGFKTILFVKKGREKTYNKYNSSLYDKVVLLDEWEDLLSEKNQQMLRERNTVFIPNRSFVVYTGLEGIEERFEVPLYGARKLLRAEERNAEPPRNQYHLMKEAGMRTPKIFEDPDDIDRLSVVKVQQKENPLERAYFYPSNPKEYEKMAERKIANGEISREGLKNASTEEFVIGPMLNANFHFYGLKEYGTDLDLVGFSDREQTNETGYRRLPAELQLEMYEKGLKRTNEEICHRGKTLRESKLEMMYKNARNLMETLRNEVPPGMIGPIGIQGAVPTDENDRPEFVVFDLSFRVPGDPAMGPTSPYLRYLNMKHRKLRESIMPQDWEIGEPLDLSMLEIKNAAQKEKIEEIVT